MFGSPLFLLVPLARFERAAHGLGIRCSILLSYRGACDYDDERVCPLTRFFAGVNKLAVNPSVLREISYQKNPLTSNIRP